LRGIGQDGLSCDLWLTCCLPMGVNEPCCM
jgi:hypothetical protein